MPAFLRHIPNFISALRILLVAPIAVSLAQHRPTVSVFLFGVAALTDAIDGLLAKRFGWQSALGGVLDPAADKLLLVTVLIMLAYLKLVPLWLVETAVLRDVVIVGGALAYRFWIGPLSARPSMISKLNTLFQAGFVLAVVGREAFSGPPAWLTMLLGALLFVTVVISGIDYVLVYGRQAWSAGEGRVPGASRSPLA
ncbi:MAG: CDP-alcohol phosphatidyltransferase family protein [Pseudomonadota bacterium]|nr:CDP-alcohol phosphatidyltransferase family protein [Pseudomonadota bacterium]